ncbi:MULTISPECIES: PTS system mannose/fructose/N-acetylgalactosamine-transporter subunit IIB [Enterococcus]|uniref:PTS EIIB type-4 domain-containing protein n=1 Tax=Enterococcus mundtii TaxID=53346 RepID=A0A2S7RXB0_ENTMU|nr:MULTISPECIES: PTS sugar transporter subunit IIB [Enterococcus]PQF24658.1 hypothetical protein CUS89_03675 [Enterococcus mundtii]PWF37768.1 PTS mannose/fructose/sorbose transporter subunit IIB [Enterococcus faecium]
MGKTYIRVDDRLVHGQITTNWIGYLNVEKIIVIDDKTATTPMLKSIMSMAVPNTIEMEIVTQEKFSNELIKSNQNTLIIVKYPASVPSVLAKYDNVDTIIVGTVVKQAGAKKINKNIYLTTEFENALNDAKTKTKVVLQQLPDSPATEW